VKHAALFNREGPDREFCCVQIDRICGAIIEDETLGDSGLQEYGKKLEDRSCEAGEQVFRSDVNEELKGDIMVEGGKFVWFGRTEEMCEGRQLV
jgi:hypothetical protein